jgi:hypothetical protein
MRRKLVQKYRTRGHFEATGKHHLDSKRSKEVKIEITDEPLPKMSGGVKAGKNNFRKKIGIHAITPERRREINAKNEADKKGIFAKSDQERKEFAAKVGKENVKTKRGMYSPDFLEASPLGERRSTEDRHETGRKLAADRGGFHSDTYFQVGPHIRWHVNRDVFNPKCYHCVNETPLSENHKAVKSRNYRHSGNTKGIQSVKEKQKMECEYCNGHSESLCFAWLAEQAVTAESLPELERLQDKFGVQDGSVVWFANRHDARHGRNHWAETIVGDGRTAGELALADAKDKFLEKFQPNIFAEEGRA